MCENVVVIFIKAVS